MKKLLFFFLTIFLVFQVSASELYESIMSYQADRGALARKYNNPLSEEYFLRMDQLYKDWAAKLQQMAYDDLSTDGKLDYLLCRSQCPH